MEESIIELRKKTDAKRRLDKQREIIRRRRDELSEKLSELEAVMHKEQDDVDRLEGLGFMSALLAVIGQRDEALSIEKKEAYAAKLKYDTCYSELEAVKSDIDQLEEKRKIFGDCDYRYESLLRKKEEEIRRSADSEAGRNLLRIEGKIADYESRCEAICEALDIAEEAIGTSEHLQSILDHIIEAPMYSSDSVLCRGVKYETIINTFPLVFGTLQGQIRRLNNVLEDKLLCDISFEINGFLAFADFFFKDVLLDIFVAKQAMKAKDAVNGVRYELLETVDVLERKLDDARKVIERLNRSKSECVYKASI